jgi:hypothetical protein
MQFLDQVAEVGGLAGFWYWRKVFGAAIAVG